MRIQWKCTEQLMKYLLKVVRISYEKHNEIAWNIGENPMKVHWTTNEILMKNPMREPSISNEISIESSKD